MTHDELDAAANRARLRRRGVTVDSDWYATGTTNYQRDDAIIADAWLADNPPDAAEPVSAAAMRQEPGWTQGTDANCFWRGGVLGTLRVWPNTGCVEFGSYVLVRAGATLGDIRKLTAVLCREVRT